MNNIYDMTSNVIKSDDKSESNVEYYKKNSEKKNNNKSINKIIEKQMTNDDINSEIFELEKTYKEQEQEQNYNSLTLHIPKNRGNLWTDNERNKIMKLLKKNNFDKNCGLFDDSNIVEISQKLERTDYAVKEEIKKMIYNEFIEGKDYDKLSIDFNIPKSNIKLILKLYMEKKSKKLINQLNTENELLKLKIENIKLRKELQEINI